MPGDFEVHNEFGGSTSGPVVQAGSISGGVHYYAPPRTVVVPRQLPASPGMFVGRTRELAALTAALDGAEADGRRGTVVVSALCGMGGIGKTWLALHWAHRHLERFPDGQLFVDLRGFDPVSEPLAPSAVVRGFLDALGVDPSTVPEGAQAERYRSEVAGRRMLLVLDNARDASQVAELLPGSPSCTVIVTSRNQLAGLVTAHGAHPVLVDVLDEAQAKALLVRRLGARGLEAEPRAVAEVLAWCEGLPLALAIVAGRARLHPWSPFETIAAELADAFTRLEALDEGDSEATLSTVLSWSYAALPDDQAEAFGLLALAPGPDISVAAAAAVVGPHGAAGRILRALERVSLTHEHAPGRYQMHDLVRLDGGARARRELPPEKQEMALRRLTDFYLHTADGGDRLVNPSRAAIALGEPVPGSRPLRLPDEARALAWFKAERSCLLAVRRAASEQGWHAKVWQLAWLVGDSNIRLGYLQDQVDYWRAGLHAAEHLADPLTLIRSHRLLGDALARTDQHAEAVAHLLRALAMAEAAGSRKEVANTHHSLARAWEREGDDPQALEHSEAALEIYRTLDGRLWEASALNQAGWFHARLGHHEQARLYCEAALALFLAAEDREGEAATLDSLGYLSHRIGDHDRAFSYYRRSLEQFHQLGNDYEEAGTLGRLGQTHSAIGDHRSAMECYRRALELLRGLGSPYEEANTLDQLAQAHLAVGEPEQAREVWQRARLLYLSQHRVADGDRIERRLAGLDRSSDRP
ncbi:ATP-binding protein [Streptacidiphilus sp. PB12-B1b]|uniref:ATP-binding protein n=1 Tax=Streptacidiphilus sp. PB12-B1b TaxID=2705012 RepID=UPI0015F91181|nr:tetratricopeptide repeat protein [Streptacidiphilus sp. PB12-B1b]QMU76634.1 ATP-binding protein [Streptacidiphilus sp. PB12-B1b]